MKRMILVLTVAVLAVTLASSAFAQVQQIAENTGDVLCTTPDACNQMNIGGAGTGPQINSITSGNSNISGQDFCGWYYYEGSNVEPWWEYWCWWPSSGWEYIGWSY